MATKLSEAEIAEQLDELRGWVRSGDEIHKTFALPSFPAAIAFVTHIGFIAESIQHHPDIDIRYNRVTLTLTTHDADGLTASDFALATQADELV